MSESLQSNNDEKRPRPQYPSDLQRLKTHWKRGGVLIKVWETSLTRKKEGRKLHKEKMLPKLAGILWLPLKWVQCSLPKAHLNEHIVSDGVSQCCHWTFRSVMISISLSSETWVISVFVTTVGTITLFPLFGPDSALLVTQDYLLATPRVARLWLYCPILSTNLSNLRRSSGTPQLVIHYLFSKDSTPYMRGTQVIRKVMTFRNNSFGVEVISYWARHHTTWNLLGSDQASIILL